jgi:uncharacterized protein (DUF2336 family)
MDWNSLAATLAQHPSHTVRTDLHADRADAASVLLDADQPGDRIRDLQNEPTAQ